MKFSICLCVGLIVAALWAIGVSSIDLPEFLSWVLCLTGGAVFGILTAKLALMWEGC